MWQMLTLMQIGLRIGAINSLLSSEDAMGTTANAP